MQGSAMVGRNVLIADDTLAMDATAHLVAAPSIWPARRPACPCRSSMPTRSWWGPWSWVPLKEGRYNFEWDASEYTGTGPLHFKVLAANGKTAVDATALSVDQVTAVSLDNGALALQLSRGGSTNYNAIKAIL